MQLGLTCCKCD